MGRRKPNKPRRERPVFVHLIDLSDDVKALMAFSAEDRNKILANYLCGSCGTTEIALIPLIDSPLKSIYVGHEVWCPVRRGAVDPVPNYRRAIARAGGGTFAS